MSGAIAVEAAPIWRTISVKVNSLSNQRGSNGTRARKQEKEGVKGAHNERLGKECSGTRPVSIQRTSNSWKCQHQELEALLFEENISSLPSKNALM